jgi:hypothetical protein
MKRFLTICFVTLGVIFFVLILAGTAFYIIDPYNLKPLLFGGGGQKAVSTTNATTTPAGENPRLSPAQEKALKIIGVDPASVPSSFTPAQTACFTGILGAERVAQIKAGDAPTAAEYFKVRSCL